MISHFHGSKYNRFYRDKRVFLLVSCCSPYSILWVFQVLTIFIFLLIFSHFILHLRLFFLISHNSMFFVHFAQLDWNLLHQIWDFTPAFLSFPYFVLYLPAEIHKRQIAFCFPHEVGTFLSRLYFLVWIHIYESRNLCDWKNWYMLFWCLSLLATSINYGETRAALRWTSKDKIVHILLNKKWTLT